MYNASNRYKEVIKSNEQRYGAYIELENGSKIYSNSDLSSLKLNDTIGNNLMGSFSPKKVKLSILNNNEYNLTDKKFKLFIGVYLDNNEIEYIPQGTFIVSKPADNNKGTKEITLEAKDMSYLFDIEYDREKFEDIFPCTVLTWSKAICNEIGIQLANINFINSNIVLDRQPYTEDGATYRKVIAKISESSGCFAKIGRDDKLYFKSLKIPKINEVLTVNQVNKSKISIIDAIKILKLKNKGIKKVNLKNMFEQSKDDLKYGPLNSIVASRIVADDGSTTEDVYKRDEESIQKNGLCEYKIKENWIIDDNREEFITNILNNLNGLEFNTGKIEVVADPTTDIGDFIEVEDVDSNTSFFMPIMDIEINIDNGTSIIESNMPSKTETDYKSATTRKDIQRRTELKVNKLDGEIKSTIELSEKERVKLAETKYTVENITNTVSDIKQQVDTTTGDIITIEKAVNKLEENVNGLQNTLETQGGSNLLLNSSGLFQDEYWEGTVNSITNTDIQNNFIAKACFNLKNGSMKQVINVVNSSYYIGFKYQKLLELANCKILINGTEIELSSTSLKEVDNIIEVSEHSITIELISDTDNACLVGDIIVVQGSKQSWSSNMNEIYTSTVKIGIGLEITSNTMKTRLLANADGVRIVNTINGNTVAEFTDKGMATDELKANTAQIAGILIQKNSNQTWISSLL